MAKRVKVAWLFHVAGLTPVWVKSYKNEGRGRPRWQKKAIFATTGGHRRQRAGWESWENWESWESWEN